MNKESNKNVYLGGKGEIYPLITMEDASRQKPKSNWDTWIRVVVLIIAAVFVFEQAAWAGIWDTFDSLKNSGITYLKNTSTYNSFNTLKTAVFLASPGTFFGMKLASSILSLRSPLSNLNINQQIIPPISKYALGFTSTLTSWANKLPSINSFSSLNNIFTSLRSFNPQSSIPLTNSAFRIGSLAISTASPAIFGGIKLASSILSWRSPRSNLDFNQQVLKPLTDFGSNFRPFRIGDTYQNGLLNKVITPKVESNFIFRRLTNVFLKGQLGLMNRYIDRKAGFKF